MRTKTTLKGLRVSSLPESIVRNIQSRLIRGKKTAEIATKSKVSSYVVNSIRTKMVENGLLNPTTRTPRKTKTLNNTYTRLMVNDVTIDIEKATSVVINKNGVKITY